MGMLGVAAVTGLSYAITSSLSSGDSEDEEDDAELKSTLNNFERFGAEYFLTDFGSKRSFGKLTNAKLKTSKKKKRRR